MRWGVLQIGPHLPIPQIIAMFTQLCNLQLLVQSRREFHVMSNKLNVLELHLLLLPLPAVA